MCMHVHALTWGFLLSINLKPILTKKATSLKSNFGIKAWDTFGWVNKLLTREKTENGSDGILSKYIRMPLIFKRSNND